MQAFRKRILTESYLPTCPFHVSDPASDKKRILSLKLWLRGIGQNAFVPWTSFNDKASSVQPQAMEEDGKNEEGRGLYACLSPGGIIILAANDSRCLLLAPVLSVAKC